MRPTKTQFAVLLGTLAAVLYGAYRFRTGSGADDPIPARTATSPNAD